MKAILALDQGTTSSRAIAFDADGSILAVAQRELRQIYPQPGWVEHDPREIAASQLEVAAEASRGLEVTAIGITNQRETTILWDRNTGEPIHNAIVWQDRRTAAMCDELREYEPLFRERTGLVLDPYFSGTKIRWLLDAFGSAECGSGFSPTGRPEGRPTWDRSTRELVRRGDLAFGTVDSWLIWNLTKGRVHVTDATNASRTLLFNIHTGEWDDDLLRILKISREILPRVVSSSEVVGETDDGIPIAGIAGDQQAALFGQRCVNAGMAKNTYGTGCFIVMNTGDRAVKSQHGLLTTLAAASVGRDCVAPGTAQPCPTFDESKRRMTAQFALEGSVFIAGAAIQWLRDSLGIIRTASDVEALASSVPDSGGVTFIPAFTGLGAPHWNPHARGAMLGLTRGTTSAHIARAALEAIALQTAEVLEAMREDSGLPIAELRVDGGASRNNLLMQIQADVAQVRVVRSAIAETTALGAAYLAGLSPVHWKADRVFEPQKDCRGLRERWAEAIRRVTQSF